MFHARRNTSFNSILKEINIIQAGIGIAYGKRYIDANWKQLVSNGNTAATMVTEHSEWRGRLLTYN